MHKLSINALSKSFEDQPVLKDITLEIAKNSITVLLGHSGSGKSTLLRCLCQLETPEAGQVLWGEKNCLKVGMVFQQLHLWNHMSVLDNLITAPLRVLKQSKQTAVAEALKLLTHLGIPHKSMCSPNTLSGGEQQRVAIARALMMKPEILLFDEPTSALDPEHTYNIAMMLQNLAREGITLLVATHDISFAKKIANQVVFLEHGTIQEIALIQNNTLQAKTKRFQQFLQSTNISTSEETHHEIAA